MEFLKSVRFTVKTQSGACTVCEVRNVLASNTDEAVYIALGWVSAFFYDTYHKITSWKINDDYIISDYYIDLMNREQKTFSDGKGFVLSYRKRNRYARLETFKTERV